MPKAGPADKPKLKVEMQPVSDDDVQERLQEKSGILKMTGKWQLATATECVVIS